MDYVTPLSRVTLADADRVGRKAAVLGSLRNSGFRVPDGFAISWSAAAAVSAAAGTDIERAELLRTAPLPETLPAEIDAALAGIGNAAVAVRSSGVAEDTDEQSFAGQYDSYLNVSGSAAVIDAVRKCWASAYSERIGAYRGSTAEPMKIGVLVQVMVPATAAGVAFTLDPVSGDREVTTVSAVPGLGERLMAGESVADEWSVGAAGPVRRSAGNGGMAVDETTVSAVAVLAARVAEQLGAPQDIEWAFAGEELWLLQARPITVLGPAGELVPIEIEVPDGFSVKDGRSTAPWVPLQTSLYLPVFDQSAKEVFAFTTGVRMAARSIGGWIYLTTPADTVAAQVARAEEIAVAVAQRVPEALVQRWFTEWKPDFVSRIASLGEVVLAELTDSGLVEHVVALREIFAELHAVYFRLSGAGVYLNAELGCLTERLLGWAPSDILQLRGGLVGDHLAFAVALADLARMAESKPAVRSMLREDPAGACSRLNDIDVEFARRFDDYVAQYGRRSVGFDITEPTFAEQPAVLLGLVAAQLDSPFDLDIERSEAELRLAPVRDRFRRDAAALRPKDRERLERALAAAERSQPVRDEKVYVAVTLWALARYAAVELGARLAAAGDIDRPADVFFLELEQACVSLLDGVDCRAQVRLARGRHNWAYANPGPRFYGAPPAPLAAESDAPEPTAAAAALLDVARWSMSLFVAGAAGAQEADVVTGIPAAVGRFTGVARVVRDVAEFGRVRRGDVLVCPETTAQWAVLFPILGALVADGGSLLSHPAILAREYGIPAVVATGTATTTLRDGDLVEVDGSAGTVRLVSGVAWREAAR